MVVAEQLHIAMDTIDIPHAFSDAAHIVTIGVSTYYPQHSKAGHIELLDAADRGLYRAKNKGQNRIELSTFVFRSFKSIKALALLELNLVEYLGSLLAPQILELGCPLYPPRLLRQESCDYGWWFQDG